jgi:two-component system, NtrC family, sensor kinase
MPHDLCGENRPRDTSFRVRWPPAFASRRTCKRGSRMKPLLGFQARLGLSLTLLAFISGATGVLFSGRGTLLLVIGLLVCPAAAAAVAFLLHRSVERQAARLTEAAAIWGQGDLIHRTGTAPRDAFGKLGEALNRMAASLQAHDETTKRRAEEQIIQAEKLATVGQLAAGVAHEINNPLGGILLYGNLLIESTPADDPRRQNMQRIVTQAGRAREIVRGLLDFARQTPSTVERADLNRIIAETLALLERHPQFQNVQVRLEESPIPLWVRIDSAKIQQVFVNILMNAVEAMRDGGTLVVRSGFSERPGFCRVAVTDTGCGIPPENIPHLFDPFFTTKEVGKGTGLGLAISYGIVKQHGGEIEVQSTVGAGTTFRVLLPAEMEER